MRTKFQQASDRVACTSGAFVEGLESRLLFTHIETGSPVEVHIKSALPVDATFGTVVDMTTEADHLDQADIVAGTDVVTHNITLYGLTGGTRYTVPIILGQAVTSFNAVEAFTNKFTI